MQAGRERRVVGDVDDGTHPLLEVLTRVDTGTDVVALGGGVRDHADAFLTRSPRPMATSASRFLAATTDVSSLSDVAKTSRSVGRAASQFGDNRLLAGVDDDHAVEPRQLRVQVLELLLADDPHRLVVVRGREHVEGQPTLLTHPVLELDVPALGSAAICGSAPRRSMTVRWWLCDGARMPSVPSVSLLSHARTDPDRYRPR